MNILILFIKGTALVLFYFISAYVILCGKHKSGINLDYVFAAIMFLSVLVML